MLKDEQSETQYLRKMRRNKEAEVVGQKRLVGWRLRCCVTNTIAFHD